MAEVRLKVVLDGAEQTINTVSQLEDALQRTKNELAGLEIGSTGFKTLQNQARQLDSELKNIQKATEGVDTAKLAGSFAKLGESVVGAFAISTSALKLFGKESEDVVKAQEQAQQTLNIVLGARAIAEGVVEGAAAARLVVDKVSIITTSALTAAFGRQTIALAAEAAAAGTATAAQQALNTAMRLSPIALLVTAIAGLIVYWDDLAEATGLSTSELEAFKDEQKKVADDLDAELNKQLAESSNKFFELGNAIEFSTGAAQKSWIQQALKDLPELVNLTGQEADAVERTTAALRNRQTIADIEAERARNLAEIAKLEEQFIASNKGTLQLTKEQSNVLFQNVNALREQNIQLNQRLGLLNSELNETIKIEGEKKKAADDAKKAQEEAAKRRIEQIKNERKEIQDLLKVTKDETLRNAQDVNFQLREIEARRITNRFEQAKALEKISIERTESELKNQRDAAIKEVNETILSTTEKEKARNQITDEFNKQIEDAKKISSTNIVSIEKEQNAQIQLAAEALRTELNFGDANFTDTIENRALESVQFENELNQRKLQDALIINRLSLRQQTEYYEQLQALQSDQLDLERQARLNDNEDTLRQELQLAKDREELGDITAAQLLVIETNLNQTKAIEDEKVERDIAQKRIAINKQTEEQILQTRIQSIQAYLAAATTGLQALASVSQAVEQNQLNAITERTNTELNANQQKNQSILDQELARIDAETTNESDKVKKRNDAIAKSQDQKAKDDKKTEEKIEKQRNEIRKKAFARTKALNIATALVNGAQAVLSAIAQFGPPPSPLGIAGIAAAGVLTAAQVAAISSQQYQEEGGGPSRELSVPETAGVGEVAGAAGPPSGGFTLFNPDLVNVTQTGGRGAAGGGGTMGPLRVIVVESDITDAQKSVRTTVDQASFG